MSWITKNSGETDAAFISRLEDTLLAKFKTSAHVGTTIAYSANGLILRQCEESSSVTVRGLDESAVSAVESLESDTTSTTIYYKAIDADNGEYAVVGVTTGTRTTVSSSRANDAGEWVCTVTTTTYSAASDTGWSTTRPSAASQTGIQIDYEKTSTRLYTAFKGSGDSTAGTYGISTNVAALYQNVEKSTWKYQFLTQAEAIAKVSSLNGSHTANTRGNTHETAVFAASSTTASIPYLVGTTHKAVAAYVSEERGWTVTDYRYYYSPAAKYSLPSGSTLTLTRWYIAEIGTSSAITASPFIPVSVAWSSNGKSWKILEGG